MQGHPSKILAVSDSGWLGQLDKPSPAPRYHGHIGLDVAKVGMLQCGWLALPHSIRR